MNHEFNWHRAVWVNICTVHHGLDEECEFCMLGFWWDDMAVSSQPFPLLYDGKDYWRGVAARAENKEPTVEIIASSPNQDLYIY